MFLSLVINYVILFDSCNLIYLHFDIFQINLHFGVRLDPNMTLEKLHTSAITRVESIYRVKFAQVKEFE